MLWQFNDDLKQRKIELISSGYNAYCLFVLAGQEINIADEINNNYPYSIATPLTKMSHRSRRGYKYDIQEVLLSSYVFVYLPKDRDIFKIQTSRFKFRILEKDANKGALIDQDLEYANWVLEVGGLISVSEAIKYNGKVKIVGGPLKRLEGKIVEYSRRSRNCCIEIELMNQIIKTWLPFDWVDAK